jgi:tRNA pseudouridine38-40 synthase
LTEPHTFGVLLTVAYDGTGFAGFARQKNARTVAGEMDGAVRAIDPRASLVRVCSRTDAGVHARGQRVAFDTSKDLETRGWALALLQHLPPEIAVVRVARIEVGFEPSRRALRKTYRYVILESVVPDPFWEHRAWRVRDRLNHAVMRAEAHSLLGEHDFRAFRGSADERDETVRTILRADLQHAADDPRAFQLTVTGNRFLYRMMRIICGTLVDVGRERILPGACTRAMQSGVRTDLGITAPPDGLYLQHVDLDDDGHDAWPPDIDATPIVT